MNHMSKMLRFRDMRLFLFPIPSQDALLQARYASLRSQQITVTNQLSLLMCTFASSYHAGTFSERVAMYVSIYACIYVTKNSVAISEETIAARGLKFGVQLHIYCF